MTIKQEYLQFLKDNFDGFKIRKPLFYSWKYGLRFNLQTGDTFKSTRQILDADGKVIPLIGDTNTNTYFIEVIRRASALFESAFDPNDQIFFVFLEYKFRKRKIRFYNYAFKQINNLEKSQVSYMKVKGLYNPDDKFDIRNMVLIKLQANRINYKNILTAIGNADFPPRLPRLDKRMFSSKEIYFINIEKKLIFHMYDDRGLDIIASDKETLRPIYQSYNDWILDYDRKEIDKQFE